MTETNRVSVPVILAGKHWDTIIRVLEPEIQQRGKDWLPWWKYITQAIQANSRKGSTLEGLAMVTLAEANWLAICDILEANCRKRSQEWITWAGNVRHEIQVAIENAKMSLQEEDTAPETEPSGASPASNEVKPAPETTTHPDARVQEQAIANLRYPERRQDAIQTLVKAGGVAVEALLASLRPDEQFETKLAVREILAQMGSPAVDALLAAFHKNEAIEVARIAAEALGKIGDARAVEPLIGQFLRAKEQVTFDPVIHGKAQFAARALAKIRDERAITAFAQVLEDNRSHEVLRSAAIQALGELRAEKVIGLLTSVFNQGHPSLGRQAAEALGKIGGDQIVAFFISALQNPNVDIRVNAAAGLKDTADMRGVEPLISALNDPYWLVRNEAIRSLGALGDQRAVEGLIVRLDDPMFDVRWSAAMVLGTFRDKRALPKLIAALHGQEAVIRRSAAKSLGQIGDPGAVDPLIEALVNPLEADLINSSQEAAAEALGMIGDAKAVVPLASALSHPNRRVQEKASKALERISTTEAPAAVGR